MKNILSLVAIAVVVMLAFANYTTIHSGTNISAIQITQVNSDSLLAVICVYVIWRFLTSLKPSKE